MSETEYEFKTTDEVCDFSEQFICCFHPMNLDSMKRIETEIAKFYKRYPSAYPKAPKLGHIQVNEVDDKYIVNMCVRKYGGCDEMPGDLASDRKKWLDNCFLEFQSKFTDIDAIAFFNLGENELAIEFFAQNYQLNNKKSIRKITLYTDSGFNKSWLVLKNLDDKKRTEKDNKQSLPTMEKRLDISNQDLILDHVFEESEIVTFKKKVAKKTTSLFDVPYHASWKSVFENTDVIKQLTSVDRKLKSELGSDTVYPKFEEIFNAFQYTTLPGLKAIILGQDPYHTRGAAHGLSFSIMKGNKVQPSVKNIFKALENDAELDFVTPTHGCLVSWAEQGVLLLNCALTVRDGKPNSHAKEWATFTDALISMISKQKSNLVFFLWGRFAQKKKDLIVGEHLVLEYTHPSSMSRTDFGKCRHFSECNKYLKKHHDTEIDWSL